MSSHTLTTSLDSFFPSWTLGSKVWLEANNNFPLEITVTKIRSTFQENFVFLTEKTNLVLHQFTVNNNKIHLPKEIQSNLNADSIQKSFLKVPFSQTFYYFLNPNRFVPFFPQQPTIGKNHFSLTTIYPVFIPSLHQQHISYLLYTLKWFPNHFYVSQFLTLENLNKTKNNWLKYYASIFWLANLRTYFITSKNIHFS